MKIEPLLSAGYIRPALSSERENQANASLPAHSRGWYSSPAWRTGRLAARRLPRRAALGLARVMGTAWWAVVPQRRRAVVANLLPVTGSLPAARRCARRLFAEFACKLVDLWRFESGLDTAGLFAELQGWEHVLTVQKEGRGMLLVSPHLGNWELGAPLLASRGVKLTVITRSEPAGLTPLREKARAQWGIQTVVVGDGAFGFVEVIRHLENGACVALLVDRPAPESAVTVQLFGRPFAASVAPAELARASGCAILPTTIVRTPAGYRGMAALPVPYERAALRHPEARQALTQRIMDVLAPVIAAHPEQWFHFAPLWPSAVKAS
ncbi:MAG: lysophospholipid acyltransferase family protein [Verrucomicrobiae bacterium]|nr:lysophospholipid acyltransferase family protein [Verrucomicrobiae bacterium]